MRVCDHLGNEFKSTKEMCKFYNIRVDTYYQKRKDGIPLSNILSPISGQCYVDHLGNRFNSLGEMCKYHNTTTQRYYYRQKSGFSLKESLEGKVLDHLGNSFTSLNDMAKYHNFDFTELKSVVGRTKSAKDALVMLIKERNRKTEEQRIFTDSFFSNLKVPDSFMSPKFIMEKSNDFRYYYLAKYLAKVNGFELARIPQKQEAITSLLEIILSHQDDSYKGEELNIRKSLEFFKLVQPGVLDIFYLVLIKGEKVSKSNSSILRNATTVASDISYFIDMVRRIVYSYMIVDSNASKGIPESILSYVSKLFVNKVDICNYSKTLDSLDSLNYLSLSGCLFLTNYKKKERKEDSPFYNLKTTKPYNEIVMMSKELTRRGVSMVCDIGNSPVYHARYRMKWSQYVADMYGIRLNPMREKRR